MSVPSEIPELEEEIGEKLPPDIGLFLRQSPLGDGANRVYRWKGVDIELRHILDLNKGAWDLRPYFRELALWSKGEFLPLVADMRGQYVGVFIRGSKKGYVYRTQNYLGDPDDDVEFLFLAQKIDDWVRDVRPAASETLSLLESLGNAGTAEECEKLARSTDLTQADEKKRTLLDIAAMFGNRSVVQWCLSRNIKGRFALAAAIAGRKWEVAQLLLEHGFGLDRNDPNTLRGVPVINARSRVPQSEQARFMELIEQAELNLRKSSSR